MGVWKTKWGWRADFILKGERVIAKGFFKYKDEARQWVKNEKTKLKESQKNPSSHDRDLSLWALSQKYLADCKLNFTQKTFAEKRYCLERFYNDVGDIEILSIDPPMILDFINARAKAQSSNSANKDRKNLRAFYSWVQEMYGVMYDPTAPIKKKSHTKKVRRLIPIADILKVILVTNGHHDRAFIASYWHTGARRGEIIRWVWGDDVNFEERWVRLGTKKSKDGSMVYEKLWMNDDLHNLLTWHWKYRDKKNSYVFPKFYCLSSDGSNWKGEQRAHRFLKKLCEEAKVEVFGFHDIRHTVAKYLNDLQKVNLKKVQQVLRHRKQTTTEIYVEGNYTDTKDAIALLEMKNLEKFS